MYFWYFAGFFPWLNTLRKSVSTPSFLKIFSASFFAAADGDVEADDAEAEAEAADDDDFAEAEAEAEAADDDAFEEALSPEPDELAESPDATCSDGAGPL